MPVRSSIDGLDVTALADAALVAFRNRKVGFVFQFHHLLPEFSAVENAEMPMRIARAPMAEARPRAEALLQRVGLTDRLTHRPGMLSGGEQQRVAMARALIMQPALLLADEPTGDLDEETADSLHALLREMHAAYGLTSVIATHNPRLAAACDRVLRLEVAALHVGTSSPGISPRLTHWGANPKAKSHLRQDSRPHSKRMPYNVVRVSVTPTASAFT